MAYVLCGTWFIHKIHKIVAFTAVIVIFVQFSVKKAAEDEEELAALQRVAQLAPFVSR